MFVVCLNNGLFKYLCRTADDNIVEGLNGTQGNTEGKLTNLTCEKNETKGSDIRSHGVISTSTRDVIVVAGMGTERKWKSSSEALG